MEIKPLQKAFNFASQKPELTLNRAVMLFDWIADMPDILFKLTKDGCQARAHLVCQRMMDKGYDAQKAWIFRGSKDDEIFTVDASGQKDPWSFHVAPVLAVRMPDGRLENMVFDPSTHDGPVPFAEWVRHLGAAAEKACIVPFGTPPFDCEGDYTPEKKTTPQTDDLALETMRFYRNKINECNSAFFEAPRAVYSTESRKLVMAARETAVLRRGDTWMNMTDFSRAQEQDRKTAPDQQELDLPNVKL